MNFLAHLLLAHDASLFRIGQLAADFLRGPVDLSLYPAAMQRGIEAHRTIDRFTDAHPAFRASVMRLRGACGLASGVAIDLIYDHALSRNWSQFSAVPRVEFIDRCYGELALHAPVLPPRLARVAPYLAAEDWLGAYATRDGLETAIRRTARRLRRPAPLLAAIDALDVHFAGIETDFLAFFPEVSAMARDL